MCCSSPHGAFKVVVGLSRLDAVMNDRLSSIFCYSFFIVLPNKEGLP